MSDWQAGDLALCVNGREIDPVYYPALPKPGRIYTVERAGMTLMVPGETLVLWLVDGPANVGGERVWAATRFVKVTPPAADAFDRETIKLMNRKPVSANA